MKFTNLKSAISEIKNYDLIIFSGMQLHRAPTAAVKELIKQDKIIKIVGTPNPLPMELLIKNKLVNHLEFCFMGFRYEHGLVIPTAFRKAIENNKISYKETGAFSIIQGLRASAMGMSFIEIPNFKGSDLCKQYQKIKNPFNGRETLVRKPIIPEFAIIHAQYVDSKGNVYLEDPLNDRLIAKASNKVIITYEEKKEFDRKPDINNVFVDHLVHLPHGAYPTSCKGYYDYDADEIKGLIYE